MNLPATAVRRIIYSPGMPLVLRLRPHPRRASEMPAHLPESHRSLSCSSGMSSMPSMLKPYLCLRAFAFAIPTAWHVLPSERCMPISYLHSGLLSTTCPDHSIKHNSLLTSHTTFCPSIAFIIMTLKSLAWLFIVHFSPPENKLHEGKDCIVH